VLKNRNILLGVTGSIAAYKSVEVARRLMDEGAVVNVVMTDAACRFITPYTFEAVTGNAAVTDLFKNPYSHLDLSKDAHLFIIAPATANTINKLSCGIADNLLSNLWLTYRGPILMAPAMNSRMYLNPLVQKHIKTLKKTGVNFTGPAQGSLACGEEGIGRMAEVNEIVEAAISSLAEKDLSGRRVLVTAGPTREPIDPVRYISNRSSGKMGYAVARAALRRGAKVTLISGPSSLTPPEGTKFISVERASEMEFSVMKHLNKSDIVIMTAAVSDFSPASTPKVKFKKNAITSIDIIKNTDILKKISSKKGRRRLVGFAAETGNAIKNVGEKLKDKKLDLIVLNDVTKKGAGFDVDTNIVTIIDKKGRITELPLMKKIDVADAVIDKVVQLGK
jgi:phosphopantothenoylcysteine decarboxylase/phosphopantothenate--cysteine ligase